MEASQINKKILVILSHPNIEESRANKALIQEIKDLENVTVRNIDKIYGTDTKAFDIKKEQELLLAHDRIIFQFPLYWYSSPPMLKAYQDEVFTYGFAYGNDGGAKLIDKEFKIAVTIGSPEFSFQAGGWSQNSINELLKPFQSTAYLTGMIYTRVFKVYETSFSISDDELKIHAKNYKEELEDNSWDNGLNKYMKKLDEK